jgi:hypothetical protein
MEVNMSRASHRPIAESTVPGVIANIGVQEEADNCGTYNDSLHMHILIPLKDWRLSHE